MKKIEMVKNSMHLNKAFDDQANYHDDLNQFVDPSYPSMNLSGGQEYDEDKNTLLMDDGP